MFQIYFDVLVPQQISPNYRSKYNSPIFFQDNHYYLIKGLKNAHKIKTYQMILNFPKEIKWETRNNIKILLHLMGSYLTVSHLYDKLFELRDYRWQPF